MDFSQQWQQCLSQGSIVDQDSKFKQSSRNIKNVWYQSKEKSIDQKIETQLNTRINPEQQQSNDKKLIKDLRNKIKRLEQTNHSLSIKISNQKTSDVNTLNQRIKILEEDNKRLTQYIQKEYNFSFCNQFEVRKKENNTLKQLQNIQKTSRDQEPTISSQDLNYLQDYEFIVSTLQQAQQHLKVTTSELKSVKDQYKAYKIHRKKRDQIKIKQKIQYKQRQDDLEKQVLRLNDQLSTYRQTQIENRQMKKQLDLMLKQIQQLRSLSQKSSINEYQKDSTYVKELNSIIDQHKLEECKLNQKIINYQKSNQQLRKILKDNNINNELLIIQLQKNKRIIEQLYDRINEILSQFIKIKTSTMKGLSLETKKIIIQELQELEHKLQQILLIN